MNIHPDVVGIDVSMRRLDIFDGRPSSCANTAQAIEPLARGWADRDVLVVLEATGAYDRTLRRALHEAGVRCARVNPGRARDFARASGLLAKTDAVDARMLADLGRVLQPRPEQPFDAARETLAALVRRRDQLVAQRKQEVTRLKGELDPWVEDDVRQHLIFLDGRVGALELQIKAHLAASPALGVRRRLLLSLPGVGSITANILTALMPELGAVSDKAVAALAGLAPINRDSGQQRGRRTVGGGRSRVREAMYMAALSATRSHSCLAARYRRFLDAGKPPKLALIALARHMLVVLNAMLRDQQPFRA